MSSEFGLNVMIRVNLIKYVYYINKLYLFQCLRYWTRSKHHCPCAVRADLTISINGEKEVQSSHEQKRRDIPDSRC